MTTDKLKQNLSAYSEFLTSENVEHIIIAHSHNKMHIVKSNPEMEMMIAKAMYVDEQFRMMILRAVGGYMNLPKAAPLTGR